MSIVGLSPPRPLAVLPWTLKPKRETGNEDTENLQSLMQQGGKETLLDWTACQWSVPGHSEVREIHCIAPSAPSMPELIQQHNHFSVFYFVSYVVLARASKFVKVGSNLDLLDQFTYHLACSDLDRSLNCPGGARPT